MIKVNCGDIEVAGHTRYVVAEFMVLLKNLIICIFLPKFGSKEAVKEEINRLLNIVLDEIESED